MFQDEKKIEERIVGWTQSGSRDRKILLDAIEQEIAKSCRDIKTCFTDDTLRTIQLFVRTE